MAKRSIKKKVASTFGSVKLGKGKPIFVAVVGLGRKLSNKARVTSAGKTVPHS